VSCRDLRPAGGRAAVPARDENRAPPPGSVSETNNGCQIKFELIQISSVRRDLLPRLEMQPMEMRPRIDRPPVLYCRGTRPSQAAKSRPRSKASPLPIAATVAVEISGPTPGTLINCGHLASAEGFNLAGDGLDALIQTAPVFMETADQLGRSRRDLVLSVFQYREERLTQGAPIDPNRNALLD